jgi:POT family proton-dependent oligopeptide transporter
MRGGMGLRDEAAAAIYGLYTALVYLAALPGGWVGDRLLGAKQSVWWGGIVIAVGHLTLAIPDARAFYVGLIIIALGSGLLKSNMSALVGQLYPEGGARRDAGFTLFYMGVNIGALIGQVVCSNLGEHVAWRWGFSVAAAGMVLGLVQFKVTRRHLEGVGEWQPHPGQNVSRDRALFIGALTVIVLVTALCVAGVIAFDPLRVARWTSSLILAVAVLFFLWAFLLAGLSADEKKRMVVIVILFLAAVVFFAGFEQAGSSFSLFAERYTDRVIGPWTLAAGMFQSLNPLFVVTLSPVIAGMWLALARRDAEPRLPTKLSWGLLLLAGGFVVAAVASARALATGPVAPTWLISIYLLHTLGELFLSPVGLSAVTKLSPARLTGQMMGIWFLGSSLGNLLAGLFAGEVSVAEASRMPERFLQVVWTAGGAGLVLWVCSRWIQRLMPGIK